MPGSRRVLALMLLALGLACASGQSGGPGVERPEVASVAPAAAPPETFSLRVVATGLQFPYDVAFGPDGFLWITERTGRRILRVDPANGEAQVAVLIPEVHQTSGQDGLLGLFLHPGLLHGKGEDYVFVAYTYDAAAGAEIDRRVKIRRYIYDAARQTLGEPLDLLSGLPGSNDHNSGRLVFGADRKLYYTIGDQGNNQLENYCRPILAQELPTAADVAARDWSRYSGKILRLEPDGSIPADNPRINGVRSHVYSYGHRNVQGLVRGPDGQLFAAEHGPKTDDEINLVQAGKNYGWPRVAGYKDDRAYVYGNWSAAAPGVCEGLTFSNFELPATVPRQRESAFEHPDFVPPLRTFFTAADDYDFQNPACAPSFYPCWPTVAPSSLELYSAREGGIPGWGDSLLMTALKTGTVYRIELGPDGRSLRGDAVPYFKTTNRYRDVAVGRDGHTFYVITDPEGNPTLGPDGLPTDELDHPGALLELRYQAPGRRAG